jgi:hypothetical protein
MPTKERYALLPKKVNKEQRLKAYYKQRSTINGHVSQIAAARKCRAKQNNIPFTVSVEYLVSIVTEKCPVFDVPLTWTKSQGFNTSKDNFPSLDRICPNLGYVEGNVIWVSYLANKMKQNANAKQLHKFADWIKTNIKES